MTHASTAETYIHSEVTGSGEPIVLIPGMTLDGGIWMDIAKRLANRYRVVSVDPRGAGRSHVPRGPYTVELLARDMRDLAKSLGIDKAVFVGHSMGGYIAAQLALDYPELVAGLGLVSSSSVGFKEALGTSPEVAGAMGRKTGPIEEIIRENIQAGIGEESKDYWPEEVERFITDRFVHTPRGSGIWYQWSAALGFDVRLRLREIVCPTLVFHGAEDKVISSKRSEEIAASIEGAQLVVVDGVGHYPMVEAPERLSAEIDSLSERAFSKR